MTDVTGGTLRLSEDLTVTRMGYGAMQLAGPHVFGPPKDPDEAIAVLRRVVELGLTHIDTSDYYGPFVTNELIRKALHPYPDDLVIVTKIGALRGDDGSWNPAAAPEQLTQAVHDNLERLGVEALDVVNLRLMGEDGVPAEGSLADRLEVLVGLREEGLVREIGVSNVTLAQVEEARAIVPVVTVQNHYNLVHRQDDPIIELCEREGMGFASFFPLGGFTPLQSGTLDEVAARLEASPMQVALAWLLQRSPAMLLIPGTSSRAHLEENVAAAGLELPDEVVKELDAIAG